MVTWPKNGSFPPFFTFFQLRSATMRLQKNKKTDGKPAWRQTGSSFLPQAPNRKQALKNDRHEKSFDLTVFHLTLLPIPA